MNDIDTSSVAAEYGFFVKWWLWSASVVDILLPGIEQLLHSKNKSLGSEIKSPMFNPLFFGHFAHIPIEEYKEDYAETLMTDDRIYDALAGDIYGIGTTLMNNKYKWLRRSYTAFLVGMSGAIVIFVFQTIGSADWILGGLSYIGQELKFLDEGLCYYTLRCDS